MIRWLQYRKVSEVTGWIDTEMISNTQKLFRKDTQKSKKDDKIYV